MDEAKPRSTHHATPSGLRAQSPDSQPSRPLVSYSVVPRMVLYLSCSILLLAYWVIVPTPNFAGSILALADTRVIMSVILASASIDFVRRPVRVARFYDDRIDVVGNGVRRTIRYGEIESLHVARPGLVKSISNVVLVIATSGVAKPLRIPNCRNRKLHIDAYSLLLERLHQPA